MMKKLSHIFLFLFRLLTGYYLFLFVWNVLYPLAFPSSKRVYLKETFHLSPRRVRTYRLLSQGIFGMMSVLILGMILFNNFAPFGMTFTYSSDSKVEDDSTLILGPKGRVSKSTINGDDVFLQRHDIVYFTTKMPFKFDSAKVSITYKNPSPDQELFLGFKDEEPQWHYATKLIDSPFLNTLTWQSIGNDPTLYQREKTYTSVKDFLVNPPKNAIIGTYHYDLSPYRTFQTVLRDYKPQKTETVIDLPLRGRHVLYAYVKNEPFIMTLTKQDLNWYSGEDPVTVQVYKDSVLVYDVTIPDDGVTDDSKANIAPVEVEIKNPGPGLPEPGVYKVVINAPGDTIIKRITTNLHKVVFEGHIYPVNNKIVYPAIAASTSATTVFTNALSISALTYHPQAKQTLYLDTKPFTLSSTNVEQTATPSSLFTKMTIPQNDVLVTGLLGYFSVAQDAFFNPIPYYVMNITKSEEVSLVDYVITEYSRPRNDNGWQTAETSFDLSSAIIDDGKLNWVIRAPGLLQQKGTVEIKNITVTLIKKPIIKTS